METDLRKWGEKSSRRSRSNLRRVHRSYHQSVSDADSGHESSEHQESIVRRQSHQYRGDEEDRTGQHHRVPPPNQVRRSSRRRGADQRVQVDYSHKNFDLHIRQLEIVFDENRRPAHYAGVCFGRKNVSISWNDWEIDEIRFQIGVFFSP